MIKVFLHGHIGKTFGRKWEFDAETPIEVFKGIDANVDGFIKYLAQKDKEGIKYRIFFDEKPLKGKELEVSISKKKKMHVFPVVAGSDTKNAQQYREYGSYGILGGLGLSFFGGWLSTFDNWFAKGLGAFLSFVGDITFEIGAALLIQGLIGALQDEPEEPASPADVDTLKSTTSFIFSNPSNNVTQGARVPIGYGRLRVGSHVISSSVLNSRLVNFNQVQAEENNILEQREPDGVVKRTYTPEAINVSLVQNR